MKSHQASLRFALLSSLLALPAFAQAPAAAVPVAAAATTSEWTIDPTHSRFGFSVAHMMVSEVDGVFHKASGKVTLDEKNLTKSSVELTIDVASIDTDLADRDKHLQSPDFFDAAKFPQITFKSTSIKKAGKVYKVTGDLTMHGVTKPVTLDVALSDALENPWGKQVRGVKVSGKVSRQDFGIAWNKPLVKGGVLVGEQVELDIQLELNK